MLGESWLRGIRRYLPWYQDIKVRIVSVHGNSLFLENFSDLREKKRVVRKYVLVAYPELNGINPSNEEEVNHFDGELADLVFSYATISFKSNELWFWVIPGIYKKLRGKLSFYPSRRA